MVKVVLKSDAEVLDEVVVTGYGNFKGTSFTQDAASTVNTGKLEDVPVISVERKIIRKCAGRITQLILVTSA